MDTCQIMEQVDTLPRRIAWFAPWTWKRRSWIVVASTTLLIAAYPLSFGPAYRLMADGWISTEAFFGFYRPIIYVAEWRGTAILDWYVSLFLRR